MSESDKILQSIFDTLMDSLNDVPYGDLLFKYNGAHKILEFAYTDEKDSENISQADFSRFIELCEDLQKSMYSYGVGAWLSFTLTLNHDETFTASFNFDGYPTDINEQPLSLDAVKDLFSRYPREITPKWLV